MQKAKQYDWQDSNLALFGSDTEKEVKKSSLNIMYTLQKSNATGL